MKKKISFLLPVLILLQFALHAQQAFELDVKKSKILWNTGKLMGGHNGHIFFSRGTLNYTSGGEPTTGIFSIDMNTVACLDNPDPAANKKKDAELRTEDFFDIERFPTATMIIRKLNRIGNSAVYRVFGDLTIKGITNGVEFTATINTTGNSNHITAAVDIERKKWGIHNTKDKSTLSFIAGLPAQLMAPDIHLTLDLTMNK